MELPQGLVRSEGVADGQEALFVLKQQINRILNHLRGGCQGLVEQSYFFVTNQYCVKDYNVSCAYIIYED